MSKPSNPQSQKRFQESLAPLFSSQSEGKSLLFIKSSSDEGVIRNGGRNGARFAPQSFLSYFKRLTQDSTSKDFSFSEVEVSHSGEERENFHYAQELESQRIFEVVKDLPRLCHIGGGHDHIYPLLMALGRVRKKIIVLNVDAHADMRTDQDFHSGTPFRQFADQFDGEFHLFQIGLHPFANSTSTMSPLKKGHLKILWREEMRFIENIAAYFEQVKELVDSQTIVIFSLDADALDGALVPGVSAVNGDGLSRSELKLLWENYLGLVFHHAPILGIYELNPVFDSLSMMSMRTLGNFVFESLK